MVRIMRCKICEKIVGWAESVVRDDQVFHRDCFRCATCNKKLDRGTGLKAGEGYHCNNCHTKQFGAMGFKKGVVMKMKKMARVTMNMQPPFAHVVTQDKVVAKAPEKVTPNSKPAPARPATVKDEQKLHEFEVALFMGENVGELKEYLKEGNADTSKWTEQTFLDLYEHIKEGKCELGLDIEGKVMRVASVVKIFAYDEGKDLLLFNPLNSFEDEGFVSSTKASLAHSVELLQKSIGELAKTAPKNAFEMNMYSAIAEATGLVQKKKTAVEIPGAFVFETTFSPFIETPRDAAARVLSWRLGLSGATGRIFQKVVPKIVTQRESTHYPGLKSEYHVHHALLKPEFVTPLQKALTPGQITPVALDEVTNTGINTHWYVWLNKKQEPKDILKQLQDIYTANAKVSGLVGDVDFSGATAIAMSKQLSSEAALVDQF